MSDIIIGVQSFTYREFCAVEAVEHAACVGLGAIEMWPKHISFESDDQEIADFRQALEDNGIWMCGYGVCQLPGMGDKMDAHFEFAASMGADYLSVNLGREDHDVAEAAIEVASKYDLNLGIHNHGPGSTFETAEHVADFCRGKDPLLGACVDTGHYMRSGQMPEHVIKTLGNRVNSMHLKDFVSEEEEVIPGTGNLDFAQVLELLDAEADYQGAYVIEYEADPSDPDPAMKQTVGVLMDAIEA